MPWERRFCWMPTDGGHILPGEKFEASQSDPIGFNGEKRFEYMIVAREDRSKTPAAELTFFDPQSRNTSRFEATQSRSPLRAARLIRLLWRRQSATPQPQPRQPRPHSPNRGPARVGLLVRALSLRSPMIEAFLIVNGALAAAWSAALLFGLGRDCGDFIVRSRIRFSSQQPRAPSKDGRRSVRPRAVLPECRTICAWAAFRPMARIPISVTCSRGRRQAIKAKQRCEQFSADAR